MISLHIDNEKIELEMRGSDLIILDEISLAVTRILYALEHSEGNSRQENLTYLILNLIEQNQPE